MKWLILISILMSSLNGFAQMRSADAQLVRGTDESPTIHSFAFAPVDSAPERYVFMWDVSGAKQGTVFLSADCVTEIEIKSHMDGASGAAPLACGVLYPLSASRGSIELEFADQSRQSAIESVRLYVAGSKSVCSTMSVPVNAGR